MIADLKKSLSECHVKGGDKTVQFLLEASTMYLVTRAKEEMWAINPENDVEVTLKQLKLSIQLLNIAKYKLSLNLKRLTDEPIRSEEVREAGAGVQDPG